MRVRVKQVEPFDIARFEVVVEDGVTTEHLVTVDEDYFLELTGGEVPVEELVEASFEFLLEREANTAILPEFDLREISDYFPEYVGEVQNRVRARK